VKSFNTRMLAAALLSCAIVSAASAAPAEKSATLKPGDPAPPLKVAKWVKGEPVKELEKGKVYVLECWATWCGPCDGAIPHVTELQKKFKDKGLIVIGMNVWENDDAAVEPFVKKMGDKMDYRVAMDDKSGGDRGKMAETWMAAAGQNGIPCSFIVDRDTKIAWIGHPMQMEKVLQKVIDGKFDAKKEGERQEKTKASMEKFGAAMAGKDWDKALAAVDEVLAADPDTTPMLAPAKVYILNQKKDAKAANKLAKELSEGPHGKDQQTLVGLAYAMLGEGEPKDRGVDIDLAMSLAEKGAAMGGDMGKMAKTFVAKGHAAKGDYAKAVEAQTAAMDGVEGRQKQMMQKDLDTYQEKAKGGASKSDAKAEEKK
jgi:thiol-disulfide isomerase/thioredoxin